MIKRIIISLSIFFMITANLLAAGSSGGSGSGKENNVEKSSKYEQAVKLIKSAKKLEKKGKTEKAEKKYLKAQKLLIASNKSKPNKPDTLNYLGFTTRKTGDFENGEKYYLQGLAIEPKHIGINEYLGELYVATNRMDLAKERLNILNSCNCNEFLNLKNFIVNSNQ